MAVHRWNSTIDGEFSEAALKRKLETAGYLVARYTFDSPWNSKPITIRFAVENVANENYYAGSYSADGIVSLGAPRTYLVSSTFNF